jgi:hypothetical protein
MSKKSQLQSVSAAIFCLIGTAAASENITASPFAFYESANQNIVIDGVSTKYALGVLGIQLKKEFNNFITASAKVGYGQIDDQKTTFSGATFYGKVIGSYISTKGTFKLMEQDNITLFGTFGLSQKELKAPNLLGTRDGLDLTGKAHTTIRATDLALGVDYALTKSISVQLSGGVSRWQIKSNAVAYYSSSGLSATKRKDIDSKGTDPIFAVSLETNKPNHNFAAKISNRSLGSQTDTSITSGELTYSYQF